MGITTNIVIIERQAIFLDALTILLDGKASFNILGTAPSLTGGGFELIEDYTPDIVLLNMLGLRHQDTDCFQRLRKNSPSSRIIIMADRLEPNGVRVALENNVKGYFLREEGKEDLYRCIESVHAGHTFLSKRVSDLVVSGYARPYREETGEQGANTLTKRETEVVALIAGGFTNKMCARQLGLSVKTIEKHRSKAMEKLQLTSAAQLVNYAIKFDLIRVDEIQT